MSYPPFPWHLRPSGVALGTLHLVPQAAARRHVPDPFPIVRLWPGRTAGGLFLVHYGPGSALEYRELVACAGIVRCGGRSCAWVTHVYVDDATSLRGGREGLGVPKRLARFEPAPDALDAVVVIHDDRRICTIRPRGRVRLWRQRVRFCAAHRHAGDPAGSLVSVHGNEIGGRLVLGRADVSIPPGSPLRELGLGRPLFAAGMADADALFGGTPFLPYRTVRTGAR